MVVIVIGPHSQEGRPTHIAASKEAAMEYLKRRGWWIDDSEEGVTNDKYWLNDQRWATIEENVEHITEVAA